MIQFKTSKENQTDRIVATLERLCADKPIGSVAIGNECRMEHAQVLKYLHRAKDEGRATPVYSGPGGIIRGWVPASVGVTRSIADQNAMQAAKIVKQLFARDKLVSARDVARQLDVPKKTVARWLTHAEHLGLVHAKYRRGWMPA